MFWASYIIDFKMIFGKKICPKCGKKMKLFYKKTPYSEMERLDRENKLESGGEWVIFNGPLHGYIADLHLKCRDCDCDLNGDSWRAVRKIQKTTKRTILTEEEYQLAINAKPNKKEKSCKQRLNKKKY